MKRVILMAALAASVCASAQKLAYELEEMPRTASKPVGSVLMQSPDSFPEAKVDLPIYPGPFEPSWQSIEANYPGVPQWLRDAKFGIWVHFGPQAAGESGDWYARKLYTPGTRAYDNHLARYGHPSEAGYKEVLHTWNPEKFDPEDLCRLYEQAGARFLMIQGVHHDNFDLWNSQYQPWNSVAMGPHRDFLAEWQQACRNRGMRFGVTFHHEYTWWWWQTAFQADAEGERAGVPYDGNLTKADGAGKWWDGLDPRYLYGVDLRQYATVADRANTPWSPPDPGIFHEHLDLCDWYARWWALRIMDVTANYDPDFIYTDGTVQGPFTGDGTGTGYKCNAMPVVMADYYNRALDQRGAVDVFSIIKFRDFTNGAVNTAEFDFPDSINAVQPWIREAPVGDWFYAPGFVYDAVSMQRFIIESVCRDGCCALNIPMRPDGSLDPECRAMLEQVGQWMAVHGQAIYGSRAWHTLGEGRVEGGKLRKLPGGGLGAGHAAFEFVPSDIRFTVGADGSLYAFMMQAPQPGQTVSIRALGADAPGAPASISSVAMLGCDEPVAWQRRGDALVITAPQAMPFASGPVALKID